MRKRKIIQFLIILIIIILLIGASYAFFVFDDTGRTNKIVVGNVKMHYTTENLVSANGLIPRSGFDPELYAEFSISGLNEYNKRDIWYGIEIIDGPVPTGKQESNRVDNSFLHFLLTKKVDNNPEQVVVEDLSYEDLEDGVLWECIVPAETMNEEIHTYKLYMWVSDDVVIGNVNADYTTSEWEDIFASVKIKVEGNLIERDSLKNIRVSLNHNGGTSSVPYIYYTDDDVYGDIPIPHKNGYLFDGYWSANLLNVQEVELEALRDGIGIDGNGYVFDNSPESDNRIGTDSNWVVELTPGEYKIDINYIKPSTTNSADLKVYLGDNAEIISSKTRRLNKIERKFTITNTTQVKIFLSLFDGVADIKLYKKATSNASLITNGSHTLTAHWSKVKFTNNGNYTFDGTSYLNTGIYLFNEDNYNRNFHISFQIENDTSGNVNATIMSSKNEDGDVNSGIEFMRLINSSDYHISGIVNNNNSAYTVDNISTSTTKVEFVRDNNIIYYSLNNGSYTVLGSYESFTQFHDAPLVFGASLENGNTTKYFTGTLSNVAVELYDNNSLYEMIASKSFISSNYIKSYTATVINNNHPTFTTQDTVGTNNNKQEVYYYTGSDAITNGNVLFAGFCWQIVRTTDNGGIRLIYNGIAENNQCTTARSSNTYLGVKGANENISLSSVYLYGDSYDYDLTTGKFHLVNPESNTRTWTSATYESFLGKYTCKNATGTNCDNVWHVGQYVYNNNAQVETTKYSIGNIDNYRGMGSSSFNAGYSSPANVGYMYNKIYNAKSGVTTGAIYGKDIEYSNGNYLVIETTSGVASSNTTIDEYHHYSCGTLDTNDDPVTTCDVVRYYYLSYQGTYYYIELTGGETVEDALKNMINYKQVGDNVDANINVISSSMKDYLEIWYDKNLKAYEGYLDTNAVYCNNRTVSGLGGWEKNGGTYPSNWLKFKQYSVNLDLACANELDRFSKGNSKARVRNPIGLITEPERGLMGADYAATESIYWGLSPSRFNYNSANVRGVAAAGASNGYYVYYARGVRAAITLAPDTVILGGTGDDEDPYQVGPLVSIAD